MAAAKRTLVKRTLRQSAPKRTPRKPAQPKRAPSKRTQPKHTQRKRTQPRRTQPERTHRHPADGEPTHTKRMHRNGLYAPALLAHGKMRFERGDPVAEIADESGVHRLTLSRLAARLGWKRPAPVPRGLPKASQLLQEAEALAASAAASRSADDDNEIRDSDDAARAPEGAARHCEEAKPTKQSSIVCQTPGLLRRADGAPRNDATEDAESSLDRLERAVLAELATVEAARAELGPMPQTAYQAQQTARTLATLTQTLQMLQRMRAARAAPPEQVHDDYDMPRDIVQFRYDLARRIDAFVASRTGAAGGDGDAGPQTVDGAR